MNYLLGILLGTIMLMHVILPAQADSMHCGNVIVEGGQLHGMSRAKIREKCGEPDEIVDGNWYYKRNGSKYRLHFDGNGNLDSLSEE